MNVDIDGNLNVDGDLDVGGTITTGEICITDNDGSAGIKFGSLPNVVNFTTDESNLNIDGGGDINFGKEFTANYNNQSSTFDNNGVVNNFGDRLRPVFGERRNGQNAGVLTSLQIGSDSDGDALYYNCLLYTSPSPRDATLSRMPSSA